MQANKKFEINNSSFVFSSSVVISGSSSATIYEIRKRLGIYPGFKLISSGTRLKYLINNAAEEKRRIYTLEVDRSQIRLTLHSSVIEPELDVEPMLRLLNVSQILSDLYTFDISTVFPYIIAILSKDKLYYSKRSLKEPIRNGENIEHVLAKRIIHLLIDKNTLQDELHSSSLVLQRLLSKLIVIEYEGKKISINEIAEKYGVEKRLVEDAIRGLDKVGYKRIFTLQGSTLVRI